MIRAAEEGALASQNFHGTVLKSAGCWGGGGEEYFCRRLRNDQDVHRAVVSIASLYYGRNHQ